MFKKLYKKTVLGSIQEWSIFYDTITGEYWTEEGIIEGIITKSKPTKVKPKNINKSNETTISQQVILEAKAKYKKKLDSGYVEDLNDLNNTDINHYTNGVMLAHKYEDYKHLIFTVNSYISAKLDGIRCKAINLCNTKPIKLLTRNGKEIVSCSHIIEELQLLKDTNFFIDQNIEALDGELYNHQYKDNFNELVSIIKKTKLTKTDIEKSKIIQYHLYDIPKEKESSIYSNRYLALQSLQLKRLEVHKELNTIKLVKIKPIYTEKELLKFYKLFVEKGYEGAIIRLDLGDYEYKRSKQLLKLKSFTDKEFEILDILEGKGNRAGTAGKLVLKLDIPGEGIPNYKDYFEASIKGDMKYFTELFKNKEKYIGKWATIQFFGRTPLNKPRIGVSKGIRDYE